MHKGYSVQDLKESCSENTELLRDSRVKRTRGSSPNVTIKSTALTRPVETFLQKPVDARQAPSCRSASCRRPLGEPPQADLLPAAAQRPPRPAAAGPAPAPVTAGDARRGAPALPLPGGAGRSAAG